MATAGRGGGVDEVIKAVREQVHKAGPYQDYGDGWRDDAWCKP